MSPTQRKILEEAAQGNTEAIVMLGLSDEEIMDAVASPEEKSKLGKIDELGVGAMVRATFWYYYRNRLSRAVSNKYFSGTNSAKGRK